jgi:DNA-directed RNA polymerase specialized sigma24 family protein
VAPRRSPAAIGAFYERYEERVVRYFLRRVGDAEVAADLTAETLAAALACAHRFRVRKGSAAAWLFGIARNTLGKYRSTDAHGSGCGLPATGPRAPASSAFAVLLPPSGAHSADGADAARGGCTLNGHAIRASSLQAYEMSSSRLPSGSRK